MSNTMQDLHTLGLNPFAVTLLAESMLKSAYVKRLGAEPLTFDFPVRRGDCAGWLGVRITLQALPIVDSDVVVRCLFCGKNIHGADAGPPCETEAQAERCGATPKPTHDCCPKCGNEDNDTDDDGTRECLECGHTWKRPA